MILKHQDYFFVNCMYIIYYIIHLKRQLLLFKESKYSQDKKQTICISLLCISTLCNNCLFYNKGLFYLFVSFNFLDSIKTPPPHTPQWLFPFWNNIKRQKQISFNVYVWRTTCRGIRLGIWRFKVHFCWHRYGRGDRNCSRWYFFLLLLIS